MAYTNEKQCLVCGVEFLSQAEVIKHIKDNYFDEGMLSFSLPFIGSKTSKKSQLLKRMLFERVCKKSKDVQISWSTDFPEHNSTMDESIWDNVKFSRKKPLNTSAKCNGKVGLCYHRQAENVKNWVRKHFIS